MDAFLSHFERRAVRQLRELIPMFDKVPADKIILGVGAGFATAWGIVANIDFAYIAAGIGIITLAVGTGISSLMSKYAQTRIAIHKEEHAARLQMARDQAEFDKTNSGTVLSEIQDLKLRFEQTNQSLSTQKILNDALQKSVDILNGSLAEMKVRVEEANQKLHEMRGQAQRDMLQHAKEMESLTLRHGSELSRLNKQLQGVTGQLSEANKKLASLQVDSKQGRALASEAVQTAAKNSEAIEVVNAKVDQLTGTSGATPTVSP